MANVESDVIGFIAYGVKKKGDKPIPLAKRTSSNRAAEDLVYLAKRQGYFDAWVVEEVGIKDNLTNKWKPCKTGKK